jgi:uncharacterized membrane protein
VSTRERQFLELYRQARVDNQLDYYERTARGFQAAHQQLLLLSAVVFGISGAVALIAGLDVPGKVVWAVVAAVLPAVTTVIAAYEGLFAFERIAKLYRDAARNLRRIHPPTLTGAAEADAAVAAYVAAVEGIFERERGQWGQLASEPAATQSADDG